MRPGFRFLYSNFYQLNGITVPNFMRPICINKASKLFAKCELETSLDASNIEEFYKAINPQKPRKEFILFGRSNVGKSSLINSLVRTSVADVSKSPGKTQRLHIYKLTPQVFLVDCPGFGFTSGVNKKMVDSWKRLIKLYIAQGYCHKALCLVDAQHGLKQSDSSLLKYLQTLNKSYLLVLTKSDKTTLDTAQLSKLSQEFKLIHPTVHITSSKHQTGIEQLRRNIADIMDMPSF